MAEYQEGFNTAAETIASVDGFTQEIASFDKSTQIQCYVEGASQALNAVSGTVAAARLAGTGIAGWIMMIPTLAAVGTSVWASTEQFQFAAKTGAEINVREATQDLNATTAEAYDMHIEDYASYMEGVEGLELEIPDDVEAPETTSAPVTADSSTANANEKKKPKETA